MIIKEKERNIEIREKLKEGIGQVEFKVIASKVEMYDKIKMFNTITIKKGNSIGYHTHSGEKEIMMINKGKGLYKDDGKEYVVLPGDVTICDEGHYHGIINNEDEDLEVIAMIVEKSA